MKVKIIGYIHLTGESKKTGKPYDFYQVSCTYRPETGYTGERVLDLSADTVFMQGIEKLTLPVVADVNKDFVTNKTLIKF